MSPDGHHRVLLQTLRSLLASAQAIAEQLASLDEGAVGASAARAAGRRRATPPAPSLAPDSDAPAPAAEGKPRRRNAGAGRAAKARWAAMTPEERAERIRKMQSARKRRPA
jgi:hypothetical protein